MSNTPLVSIVICSHNPGRYLRSAVTSALNQSCRDIEVLLIDDGSTDGSLESIADLTDPRLRRVQQPNAGKSAALNRALAMCRGQFYALQDADDLSHHRRIEKQVRCMLDHPELAAVFCGHELLLGNRRLAPRFRAKAPAQCQRDIDAFRMPAHDPTAMYRLSLVRGIEYEPSLRMGQGYDYILRVGERHPMMVLGHCLYCYRVHPASVTRQDPAVRESFVREVRRRACERRSLATDQQRPSRKPPRSLHAQRDNNLAAHFMESVLDLRRSGQRGEALRNALACASLHPLDAHYHKALAYALAPMPLVNWFRPGLR